MGIGLSIFLVAVGAILTWAVSADVSGVDLNTVGVILMVVGAVGCASHSHSGRVGAGLARVTLPLARTRPL